MRSQFDLASEINETFSGLGPAAQSDEARWLTLLEGQTEVLDLVSSGATHEVVSIGEIVSRIAVLAEQSIAGVRCAILVQDPNGDRPVWLSGPNLPSDYRQSLIESCTKHAAPANTIALEWATENYVADTKTSDRGDLRDNLDLAEAAGFRALWSYPVLNHGGACIGVLLLHFSEPREPIPGERHAAKFLARLSSFAIKNESLASEMRSANQRFAALAENVPGVVYQRIVTPAGHIRYTYISDGAKDLFGVSPEEILADPNALFDCHGTQYREKFRERLLSASRELQMWDVEATIVTRSGQRKFTHAIARPHREPDGTVVWNGVILDATRIKESELEAAATAGRTREAILESISQGVVVYDQYDRFVVCNSHFRDIYPEFGGKSGPGSDYEIFAQALIDLGVDTEGDDPETSADARLQALLRLHRSGGFSAQCRLSSGRWVLINEHRTADGGVVVANTDVTDLKAREAALEESNQELQNFASIASHDLQEPLRKIEAFGDRLQRKCGDELSEEAALYLDRIRFSATRMRDLIDDLLIYSRVTSQGQSYEACDLRRVAEEVVGDLQLQIEESQASVEIGDVPSLAADRTQMRQLLQNLIGNALKFRKKDLAPIVKVTGRIVTSQSESKFATPAPDEMLELTITDNGIGFDMKYAERIFGIFQRLHGRSEYDGTGIGLATCRKIAERHGGSIAVESKLGEGSTFVVTLQSNREIEEAA